LRFWAAGSKLGDDLPFQEKDLLTGKKTITKLWNASRFSLSHLQDFDMGDETGELETMDRWLLSKLQTLIKECSDAFDKYEYSRAKQAVENFFWHVFCNNYLEIVKERLYNPDNYHKGAKESGQYALYEALLNLLKLMAPILPHITEEIYQMYFAKAEGKASIHISLWPSGDDTLIDGDAEKAGDMFVDILSAVRKYKSDKKLSLKEDIQTMVIECSEESRKCLEPALKDIKAVCKVKDIEFGTGTIDAGECRISLS
jgi:valyl-tRNA synthetase